MPSGYGRDSHNARRQAVGVRPPAMPEPVEFEVWDLTLGIMAEQTPREIPLNATPFCEGVRFEGTSLRPEFGTTPIGAPSSYKVLGLADHKYIRDVGGEPRLFHRIMRIVRTDSGYAQVESLEDGVWTVATTSTLQLEDTYLSVVSTQNYLLFADGKRIYKWIEPSPNLVFKQTGFQPETNLLTAEGHTTDVRQLPNGPSYDDKYTVRYSGKVTITTGADPKGLNDDSEYTVTLSVGIHGIDANGYEKKVVHTHTYHSIFFEITENSSDEQSFSFDGEISLKNIKSLWLEHEGVELSSEEDPQGLYISDYGGEIHGYNFTGDGIYGIEFYVYDAIGGQISLLSQYAPAASYIFPFADRLVALQDEGDPQKFNVSADADIETWWADGADSGNPDDADTVNASLLDSVGDPLDDLMACGFVAGNRAALLRKRTIMQIFETGDVRYPVAAQHWIEGIGTESPHSVTQARDGICFLGHNLMVYYFDGTGPPVPIGVQIQEILRRTLVSGLEYVDATFDSIYDDYILGVPEYGGNKITRLWIFSLGAFLDKKEPKWRSRSVTIERLATVSELR